MLSEALSEGLGNYRIGQKIRTLRTDKSLGLAQLGDHTGLSAGMLSKIERGQVIPTLIMFHTVGSFYGKEDTSLLKNLIDEIDIILLWAVLGLKDLNKAGRFSQSEKQMEMSKRTQAKMAPIKAFAEEFLEVTDNLNDTIICDHMATEVVARFRTSS